MMAHLWGDTCEETPVKHQWGDTYEETHVRCLWGDTYEETPVRKYLWGDTCATPMTETWETSVKRHLWDTICEPTDRNAGRWISLPIVLWSLVSEQIEDGKVMGQKECLLGEFLMMVCLQSGGNNPPPFFSSSFEWNVIQTCFSSHCCSCGWIGWLPSASPGCPLFETPEVNEKHL